MRALARRRRAWRWQPVAPVLAYVLALAPVLLAGRPSFSSYLTLSDSAVHMMGADYLLRHGQEYAHLDLRNSYGQYINDYYNTSYPSGADTLFGGSAFLLGLPLIWAFQPFNAFMLATAAGPRGCWCGGWVSTAAGRRWRRSRATVPALVYGYELIGSIKEITSLGHDPHAGRARRPAPALAAGPPAGRHPVRPHRRRRGLRAGGGIRRLGAGGGCGPRRGAGRRRRGRAAPRVALARA